jgi:hypothetical protein
MLRVPPSSQRLCQLGTRELLRDLDQASTSQVLAGEQLNQLAADKTDQCRSIYTDQ